jgi:signal transduction histidine kinase/ligand-binding sensor domain-containing protein
MQNHFTTIIIFFLSIIQLVAQNLNEIGKPITTTYNCINIGVNSQVWDFVKDSRGIVYVGSAPGVFEFDGSTWRSIPTINNTHARSLAIDKNDRVYVGASGDFGYLAPNKKGELQFISLLNNLSNDSKVFSYVWTTNVINDEIYFQSFEGIFRFTPRSIGNDAISNSASGVNWKVKVWKPKVRFNYSFWLDNTYYVQQGGVGLMKMVNDSLILLPGGEQFANDRLQVMLPYNKGGKNLVLVGTFNRGLFLFDGNSFEPFDCEASSFLGQNTLYKGKTLSDGSYVFVTLDGGMIIMDSEGNIKLLLNKRTGLSSSSITGLFVDQGLIWIAPEGSISVVEYPSPITVFDESAGQISSVLSTTRYKGVLYISTTNGVFYLDGKTSSIKQVTGFLTGNNQSFNLITVQDQLLTTHGTGLYRIIGTTVDLIKEASGLDFVPNYIHQSMLDSNRIFVGVFDGVTSFYLDKAGRWLYEGKISGVDDYVSSIAENKPGTIWVSTDNNGVLRLDFHGKALNNPKVKRFGLAEGLPPGGASIFKTSRKTLFVFSDGLYTFNEKEEKFIRDTIYTWPGQIDYSSLVLKEDSSGNLWFSRSNHVTFYRLYKDGTYKVENTLTSRLSNDIIASIYPEENGIVWFGGGINIYKFDQNFVKDYKENFNTLVRKVIIGEDSVLFGGLTDISGTGLPEIDFSKNSMVFEFSSTSMVDPSATEYQSILEGFDEKWSPWRKDSYRNYTNLPSGEYTFKVKGKNLYHFESQVASFSFKILPPWYSSWWAYACYAIILGVGIYRVDRFQRRRLTLRERQRARLRESELRAETAETKSRALQAENERRKNLELLSEIGRDITANLSIEQIIDTVYENVNSLMDAAVFGIGIYEETTNRIFFPATKEKGNSLNPFYNNVDDENRPAAWCFRNQREIFANNYREDYKKYVKEIRATVAGEHTQSIIYLPLTYKDKKIGVITAQSFKLDAYSDYHLNILRNLATYTAIAIDNADAYRQLNETIVKLDSTLSDLKSTQQKLIVQEKLASLGQLTAGIAHEIKNPLNFVNNFAQLANEMVGELREEFGKVKDKLSQDFIENIDDLLLNIEQNVIKINEHGKRADSIVRSMLQHSRGKSGDRLMSDINAMLEEDLNLAYHGLRARDTSFNITIEKDFDKNLEKISVIPQDISRVFLNIINNGLYAAYKKKNGKNNFSPTIKVKTIGTGDKIEVRIRDNGNGIPPEVRGKIFDPFFTTKPSGEGTGLGLSLSHDIIVKEHAGEIKFDSEVGEYTEFIITLPKH